MRPITPIARAVAGLLLLAAAAPSRADQLLLLDDFAGPALNSTLWGLGTWPLGRTQFGNPPVFGQEGGAGYLSLRLDTYAPGAPGSALLGADLLSVQRFPVGDGLELEARVRAAQVAPGMVASAFLFEYDRVNGGQDEIDFELLTVQGADRLLVTSWNDWRLGIDGYDDPSRFSTELLQVAGFDYHAWNTYKTRWYTDRVEWYLNGQLVRTATQPVPTTDLQVHLNFWAPGADWPQAYAATLQPVADPAANQSYRYDIDYVRVTALSATPPAPTPTAVELTRSPISDWGTGFCEGVVATNPGTAASDWSTSLAIHGTVTNQWGALLTPNGDGSYTAEGGTSNNLIPAGGSTTFGFCANRPVVALTEQALPVTRTVTSSWSGGHCESVAVNNPTLDVAEWTLHLPLAGTLTSVWSATAAHTGGTLTLTGLNWNRQLVPGGSASLGFCAND